MMQQNYKNRENRYGKPLYSLDYPRNSDLYFEILGLLIFSLLFILVSFFGVYTILLLFDDFLLGLSIAIIVYVCVLILTYFTYPLYRDARRDCKLKIIITYAVIITVLNLSLVWDVSLLILIVSISANFSVIIFAYLAYNTYKKARYFSKFEIYSDCVMLPSPRDILDDEYEFHKFISSTRELISYSDLKSIRYLTLKEDGRYDDPKKIDVKNVNPENWIIPKDIFELRLINNNNEIFSIRDSVQFNLELNKVVHAIRDYYMKEKK